VRDDKSFTSENKNVVMGGNMRGKAYRRSMKEKKDIRLRKIITECKYTPSAGYIQYDWVAGAWQPVKEYVQYPKNSNMQKYLKRKSRRAVRRSNLALQGNNYRKVIEYRWEFY
jgi:hypothetical protein